MTLFEAALLVPAGWCEWLRGYLLLSEEMRGDAERARSLGWSILEHLGITRASSTGLARLPPIWSGSGAERTC